MQSDECYPDGCENESELPSQGMIEDLKEKLRIDPFPFYRCPVGSLGVSEKSP